MPQIAFEREAGHDCAYEWQTFKGGEGYLLSVEEMIAAGYPHGYFAVQLVKAHLADNSTPDDIAKCKDMLYKSLVCYTTDHEGSKVYRLLGELEEELGNHLEALENYRTALQLDEGVGVKRVIKKLEKMLNLSPVDRKELPL